MVAMKEQYKGRRGRRQDSGRSERAAENGTREGERQNSGRAARAAEKTIHERGIEGGGPN